MEHGDVICLALLVAVQVVVAEEGRRGRATGADKEPRIGNRGTRRSARMSHAVAVKQVPVIKLQHTLLRWTAVLYVRLLSHSPQAALTVIIVGEKCK